MTSDGISNLVGQKKGAYLFKEGAKSYIFVDEESGAMCLRNGDHELQVRKDGVFVIDYKLLSKRINYRRRNDRGKVSIW